MKILFVHPNLIHSKAHFGAIKRLYNLIHFMVSRGHVVYLVCFIDKWEEKFLKYTEDLKAICKRIEIIPYPNRNILEIFFYFIFSPNPNSVLHSYSSMMRDSINSIVRGGIDIVHLEFTYMGQYIRYFSKNKFVTVLNADELNFFSIKLYLKNKPYSLHNYLKYKKIKQYELNICKRFDKVLTINRKEAQILSNELNREDIEIYPNTVDTNYFKPQEDKEEPATLVFLGNFLHTPNIDGIIWFYSNIFPLIKRQVPNARLLIVGAYPPKKVLKLGEDKCVEVTGYVNDVRPYVSKGTVFICPMRLGGGMRGKILEALAMEKICISTSIGAEGIDFSEGEGLIIADETVDFANEVIAILTDSERRKRVSKKGRDIVQNKYDENVVFLKLEKTYLKLLQRKV